MRAYAALIKRELLEHRGAFLYAPAFLLTGVFVMVLLGLVFGETEFTHITQHSITGAKLYQLAMTGVFGMWSVYLMIALFFYYADSFSADRRNNSLLFWKSMPQSDLRILTSKALAGITLFPALIFGFAMLTGILVYLMSFLVAARLPFVPAIGLIDVIGTWTEKGVVGAVYFVLTIAWYAPLLAWVASLSTVVQRWSIPLAFLVPGAVSLVEFVINPTGPHPIRHYLLYRLEGILGDEDEQMFAYILTNDDAHPFGMIGLIAGQIDWLQMVIGIAFAALAVFMASEYRRRRIDA